MADDDEIVMGFSSMGKSYGKMTWNALNVMKLR